MLSDFSKIVTLIGISSLTIYITYLYHPTLLKKSMTFLSNEKSVVVQTLLRKEESDSVSTTTEQESPASSTPSAIVTPETSKPLPKIKEVAKGPYEVLETHNSDIDYESYKPSVSPCVQPMTYRIGRFDSRFNISKEKFSTVTKEAIAVWEKEAGTPLFIYDQQNGDLTLNLIFDERQETTIDLGYLALEIENTKQAAEKVRTAYEEEKTLYTAGSEKFNNDAIDFQKRYDIYDDKVKALNDKGGATKEEYDSMMIELGALKKESEALEGRRVTLNSNMEAVNAKVKRYNELVAYANGLIRKSNSIGSRTFTEGRFVPSINTIDIFQYADETKLRRVLIHEFGHALGIGHVENAQSIMFSFNSGKTTLLSDEDKQALEESCTDRR